jgi:uncharacterized protein
MIFDLIRLKNNVDKAIEINDDITFDEFDFSGTDLIDLKGVHVSGSLTKDSMDDICLYLSVSGVMVLPCAITLEEVPYNFSFVIDDKLENILEELKNDKKVENTIDILPIIWENILMEIPMRVVSPNAKLDKLSGDGWQFVTGEVKNVNPELEKLKDLL